VTLFHALIIVAVGLIAGMVNTIVGSGSLLTFPTLLALGYAPVLANVSNTVGLISGSVSGAVGYRRELTGQLRRILALMPAVLVGTVIGASLLLALPGSAFRHVVPILILFAVVLVLVQPTVARRRAEKGVRREHPGPLLQVGTFLTSIYGGYFGAAQGVVLLGLFGITLDDDVQPSTRWARPSSSSGPRSRGMWPACCSSDPPSVVRSARWWAANCTRRC
jgi:uncharacterized protein